MVLLIFCSFLLIGWLAPDHFPPWLAFHNEAPVFLGLAAAAAYGVFAPKIRIARLVPAQLLLLALTGVVWMQLAGDLIPFAGDAFVATIYLLGFALAWGIGLQYASHGRDTSQPIQVLAAVFVLGAILSAYTALLQWTELESLMAPWVLLIDGPRARGNLAQPNQLATLLLMGVVAAVILYELRRLSGLTVVLIVSVLTFAVILSQSRTALVAAVALVVVRHGAERQAASLRIGRLAVWAWFGSVLLLTWLLHTFPSNFAPQQAASPAVMAVGLRPLMWRQLLLGLWESPWQGYGWLQTATAQQHGAQVLAGLEQTNYAHNLLLDLLLWNGTPLALSLILAGVWWLARGWLRSKTSTSILLFAWLMPLAIHSMLEFPFAYAYFLFPAGIILGMIDGQTQCASDSKGGQPAVRGERAAHVMLVAAFCALVLAIGIEYPKVEEDFRVARFENRKLGHTPTDYAPPEFRILTQWGAVLKAMRLRAEPGMPEADLALLRAAASRYSWGALHFRYALALALNGRPDAATREMALIKGLFGEEMYAQAAADFQRLQEERYPVLSQVKLP